MSHRVIATISFGGVQCSSAGTDSLKKMFKESSRMSGMPLGGVHEWVGDHIKVITQDQFTFPKVCQ